MARPGPTSIRIGTVVFDRARRQLVGAGSVHNLTPKAFELLELLAAHRPAAVSKAEILDALWPNAVVTEASLSTLVNILRTKLGRTGRDGPLRTVHGFGYALDAEAGPAGPVVRARLVRPGGGEVRLDGGETVVGRGPGLPGGTVDDASVSRRHARIRLHGEEAVVEDLGSKNGTFVNGVRISAATPIGDGDELRLGLVSFFFRLDAPAESATMTVP